MASVPIAAAVSPTVTPSLRYGSRRPVARSGSPNGPYVVAAMTAAAPASVTSGNSICAAGPPATVQCRCSAAQSSAPHPASSTSAVGARRLTRYSHASRSQAGPGRAAGADPAPDAAWCTPAAVTAAVPG